MYIVKEREVNRMTDLDMTLKVFDMLDIEYDMSTVTENDEELTEVCYGGFEGGDIVYFNKNGKKVY